MKYIILEHHPNDSRLTIVNDGICQSLTSRMGTGGGNVPIVIGINENSNGEEIRRIPRRRCSDDLEK